MEYRLLGGTGVQVSRLCLGTMTFGAEADEATSGILFHLAREAGVNVFDCANTYAGGRAEEILGRLVADCRDQVVIASKASFPTGEDVNARGSSRFHLVRAVEASLRRLGTDRIDLFYLHRYDVATALEESLRGLEDLVRQGKILYPALSNFAAYQAQRALDLQERHGWARAACVQPMYNLLKRQAEVEILPMAAAAGIGAFTYSPLAGGLLSGRYGASSRPEVGRLATNDMYRVRYSDPFHFEAAERFAALAAELGHHPASLAVAWAASHPAVTAPIIGVRSPEQLEPCLAAAELSLDDELRARISALTPAPPPATDRSEEATSDFGGR